MFKFIVLLHLFLSFSLIGLVLLQHGKGSEAGAAFGSGASQTVFGSQGSVSFLAKLTGLVALCFVITSISLTKMGISTSDDRVVDLSEVTVVKEDNPAPTTNNIELPE